MFLAPRSALSIHLLTTALLLAPATGTSAAMPAVAQSVQGIAAVVNDDMVSTQELTDRVRLALATSNLPNDPDMQRRLSQQVLRAMVDEKLERQEGKRLSIDASDTEIEAALGQLTERNKLTRPQLEQYLSQHGSSIDALRTQLAAQIIWLKIISAQIRPKVVVTDEQVDYAAKRAPVATGDRDLLLSEILLPIYAPEQETRVVKDAQELVTTLRGGGDFAALARQVSGSASGETGGDLGWIPTTALSDDLRIPLANAQPGQITDPIRTANGVQIFLVRDARASGGAAPAVAEAVSRDDVRKRLVGEQTQRLADRYLRELRRNAFVDIRG